MPDIPNKGRILRLLQYLYLYTDEEHATTTQDLIDALAETGFKANRKTVKDDIDVMNMVLIKAIRCFCGFLATQIGNFIRWEPYHLFHK